MLESKFQKDLKGHLKERYKGCIVKKTNANATQGFPDLLILYEDKWACLECKRSTKAAKRPNQEYYVDKLNSMSFASFISPETEDEVLEALDRVFKRKGE